MISPNKPKIPMEETLWITPDVRKKIFKHIYEGYTKRFGLKLLYAALNTNPELMIDYCIIYKGRNDDDTMDIILFDVPPIHSDLSTPAYRYLKRTDQEDKFFNWGAETMTILEEPRFYEYLTKVIGLSLNKEDKYFWKSQDSVFSLMEGLHNISLYYVRR